MRNSLAPMTRGTTTILFSWDLMRNRFRDDCRFNSNCQVIIHLSIFSQPRWTLLVGAALGFHAQDWAQHDAFAETYKGW